MLFKQVFQEKYFCGSKFSVLSTAFQHSTLQCLEEDTGRVCKLTCQESFKNACLVEHGYTRLKEFFEAWHGITLLGEVFFGRQWRENLVNSLTLCPQARGVGSRHHGLERRGHLFPSWRAGEALNGLQDSFHQDQLRWTHLHIGSIREFIFHTLWRRIGLVSPRKVPDFPPVPPHTATNHLTPGAGFHTWEKQKPFNSRHILHGHTYGQTVRLSLRSQDL